MGLGTATYLQLIGIIILVSCFDWQREADRAAAVAAENRTESASESMAAHFEDPPT